MMSTATPPRPFFGAAGRLPVHPYLEITRPANCVLTAVGVAVGAFVAVGPELAGMAPQLALGCGAAMACVAGGKTRRARAR